MVVQCFLILCIYLTIVSYGYNWEIRNAIKNKRRFWRIHASGKLLEYGIKNEIYDIILNGEVIKNYLEDPYNPSCLILANGKMSQFMLSVHIMMKI